MGDPILIHGEPGTGKSFLASVIQSYSKACESPFVRIDMAHVPHDGLRLKKETADAGRRSLFEANWARLSKMDQAGTVFVDNIEHTSKSLQWMLRYLLEKCQSKSKRPADGAGRIQLVSATRADFRQLVGKHAFPAELYYKLGVFRLILPPLRCRGEDIALLADYFSVKYCRKLGISVRLLSNGLKKRLTGYAWPGNISELETDIGKTVTVGSETELREKIDAHQECGITQDNCSDLNKLCSSKEILKRIHRTGNLALKLICGEVVSSVEKKILHKVLEYTDGNRKEAARILHISYKSMLNKVKLYNLLPS